MKKIIGFVLALTLCMALCAPAFAAGISGDEYAAEAQAVWEKGQPLAAAIVFERAVQAYEEAGDADSVSGAYSSAGEAYEAAGKTEQALRAYLAAKDYDKVAKLVLSGDAEGLSGDDYLSSAAVLAEQGFPASELTGLYENALAAYMSEALSGYELAAAANKLAAAGAAPEKLTGIYEKAARTLLNEAKAEEDRFQTLSSLQKANSLKDKHGNAELAAEISAALEAAQKEVEEYTIANALFGIAQKNNDDYGQFLDELYRYLKECFPGWIGMNNTQEESMRFSNTLSLAGDLCVNEELYLHAFQIHYFALAGLITYTDDGPIENSDSSKAFQTLADKITDNFENTIRHATSIGGSELAQSVAMLMFNLSTSILNDSDLALEWAARFDAMQIPCPYGTWVDAVNTLKAQMDAQAQQTGSTLSGGSLTIIVGIAAAVVFGLGGFFLGRKKKPALADGE